MCALRAARVGATVMKLGPRDKPPLAAAAERLKGKPGRPRKPRSGHITGTAPADPRVQGGPEGSALAVQACVPRLLALDDAALYLGVSPWTLRDLIANGTLKRVRIPLPHNGELRKILLDREDLDRFIEAAKEPS